MAAMSLEEVSRTVKTLDESHDREKLLESARVLAASEDPVALRELQNRLSLADFLDRLDDTSDPAFDIENLSQVFAELRSHPVAETAIACIAIYDSPDFRVLPVRVNLLLAALAAVIPVSPEAARVFRESSAEGFAEVNGPLLVANKSLLALQVFEELIGGTWVEAYVKVDILHRAVIPKRTDLLILQVCGRLLASESDPEVRAGIVETVFDYRQKEWYGPELQPPIPPSWESAATEALEYALQLADHTQSADLNDRLKAVVQRERVRIQKILDSRRM